MANETIKVISDREDIVAIADNIRSLTGITGELTLTEMATAKGSGSGGSSLPSSSKKQVNFYDYDGTILYSYTVEEAQALTSLPELPSHEGLTCQGWNYDLATIKSYNRAVDIGAMYITDDGKTRIYIRLEEGRTSPMLGCCPNGTVTVDWGDGTATDTLTGTSTSTVKWTSNHSYANAGDYVITLTVNGSMRFYGSNSSNQYCGLLRYSSSADTRNRVYQNAIQKVEIGNSVTSIGNNAFNYCYSLSSITIGNSVTSIGINAFNYCYSLSSITIPNNVTSIGNNAFNNCYSLSSITIPNSVTSIGSNVFNNCYSLSSINIPNNVTSIGTYAFNNCYSLSSITIGNSVTSIGNNAFYYCNSLCSINIPNSVTSIGNNAFNYCYSLSSITIPNNVTSIGSNVFNNCYSLSSITIPNSVTSIGNNAFYYCYSLSSITIPNSVTSIGTYAFYYCNGMAVYDFTSHTSVPTLSNTNAFNGIPSDCVIKVPASLYNEWIAATNWSTYASYIVAV